MPNYKRYKFAEPTVGDVRPINPVSTSLSIGFKNEDFLWDQIAPVAEVSEKSATYFLDRPSDFFTRQEGAERSPGGQYLRVGYTQNTATYNTFEIGFEKQLEDVVTAASQHPENLQTKDVMFLTNLMQMELEKRAAAKFFVTGAWGTDRTLSGTDQWSDFANSDPISDTDLAMNTIRQNTGAKDVDLFLGKIAWDKLKEHPLILDKYKHTQVGILTVELVAAAMGLGEIIVGDTVENTANVAQTFVGADIWTDNGLFLVKNPQAVGVANGGYFFMWNEKGNVPWAIDSYREENTRSDVNRIFTHVDPQVVSAQHGYLLTDLVA